MEAAQKERIQRLETQRMELEEEISRQKMLLAAEKISAEEMLLSAKQRIRHEEVPRPFSTGSTPFLFPLFLLMPRSLRALPHAGAALQTDGGQGASAAAVQRGLEQPRGPAGQHRHRAAGQELQPDPGGGDPQAQSAGSATGQLRSSGATLWKGG